MRIIPASLFLIFGLVACGGDDASTDATVETCETDADCGAGVICVSGVCMPAPPVDSGVMDAGCDPSRVMCGDSCVDTRTDAQNCGGCGMDCGDAPGATISCVASACVTACDDGFDDCDGDPSNGCETDLAGDDANCGACGMSCAGGSCVGSTCLLSPRGDGSAGDFRVDAEAVLNTVVTTANGGAGRDGVILGDATGFAAGQLLLLHQTQGPDAGHYELHRIESVAMGVATVSPPLTGSFGTGAGSVAQAIVVPQYASLTVAAGGRVVAPAWDGTRGGIVAVAATGAVTIEMGGSIDVTGRGFRGPPMDGASSNTPGLQGEGHLGVGMRLPEANGSGGGGAVFGGCNRSAGGGGGAGGMDGADGMGVCSPASIGGVTAGGDASPMLGGGGGNGGPFRRAAGGTGGGIVIIFAQSVSVEGAVTAGGSGGGPAVLVFFSSCGGPGGGGGGGSIFVDAETVMVGDALVTAAGGPAGPTSGVSACVGLVGGAGGAGRISIRADTLMGTTNPPAITP